MKKYSSILIVTAGLIVFGASCSLTTTVNTNVKNANVSNANSDVSNSITYPGQDGKNAVELLQQKHTVDVSAQGFVNAIDGRKPGDRQFWAFYVNGKQAEVGAKEYITKKNEIVEWKLEAY